MLRSMFLIFLLLVVCALLAIAMCPTTSSASTITPTPSIPIGPASDSSWQLVFDDHFEGDTLDPDKWLTQFPWGRDGANPSELQYYAEDAFEVANSINRIKAAQRSMAGHDYTSGIITSYGAFAMTYGYVEIRARVPSGKGFWPAFWLLPEDQGWPPEIDVFESLGHETDTVYMTNHWSDGAGAHQSAQEVYTGPDFAQAFHTFGLEWKPGELIWYIDGVERFRSNQGVPSEPMYLLVNLAVGGDWPGDPDQSTVFPGYLDVDYIRAYQRSYSHRTWLPIISKDF